MVHGVSVYALEAWSSRETRVGSFRDSSTDTMSRTGRTVDEALLFDEWVERIQREQAMNVLLIVTADDHHTPKKSYVVIDDMSTRT